MTLYELVKTLKKTDGKPAWDGWEQLSSDALDKAFRENVPDFELDSDSVKAIMLGAVGVKPEDTAR